MPKYTITASSGKKYTVNAPNGYTQQQAQALFDQQYNTGKLNQLGIGQTVNGLSKSASQTLTTVAKLANVPLTSTTLASNILKQLPATQNIGSLNTSQVKGLLGQTAQLVNQPFNVATIANGIGKFGISPTQLEQQGLLKAGTVAQFIGNSPTADFTKILASPGVWTGKDGISSLTGFLGSPNIQNITQQNILSTGLSQMKNLGLVNGTESAQTLSGLVQAAGKFGAGTVAQWTQGLAPSNIVGSITNLAKGAQFAVGLVGSLSSLFGGGGTRSVTPASNTVNRSVVDNAITAFLGNGKIPAARYGPIRR